MVDPKVQPVLALGLSALERAKGLFVLRLVCHAATLGLLGAAAFAVTFLTATAHGTAFTIEVAAAALAVGTELLALWTHHRALATHSVGRQIMRRVMLLDARRPDAADEYLPAARKKVPDAVRRAADRRTADDAKAGPEQFQLSRYYASTHPPGLERLRDHLLESAMFSQRLYAVGAKFSVLLLIAFLLGTAVVVGLMLGRVFAPGAHWSEFGVRLLIAVLAFVPASQELDHALLYRMMSERLADLIDRVTQLWDPTIDRGQLELRLVADVGDYGADTTFAPPIRRCVYRWLDPELNQEVVDRLRKLNGTSAPAVVAPAAPEGG